MQGPSVLKRPWFYCVDCSYGFSPLDKVLEISRKKHQFDIQKKATKTTAEVPFSCSSDLFSDLTGHPLSDHFMHDTFERVGAHAILEDVTPSKEEIAKRCREATGDSWRPVLVVAADGAHVLRLTEAFGGANFMSKEQWQFIVNWEAESYRQSVAESY